MLDEASKLVREFNFAVFPVQPRGKIPLIKGWQEHATRDLEQLAKWWHQFPDANIGVATGIKSGVFVLDVDVKTGGFESLVRLKDASQGWPDTLTAKTGSGGLHIYFRYDPAKPVRNSASRIAPGLDIRGEGGFVVAPPSVHDSGNRYEWIH